MSTPKITDNQLRVLRFTARPKGVTKGHVLGRDWRVLDRLEALGLCEVASTGPVGRFYAVTELGRAALESAQ